MDPSRIALKLRRLSRLLDSAGVSVRPSTGGPRFFSSVGRLSFPVEYTEGRYPNTILCHGLGSAWDVPAHTQMHQYVRRKGFAFTRFQYRDVGQLEKTWSVDDWIEDIVQLLESLYRDMGPQILVASGISATAALRAALQRPEMVESMLLLAPGVGLDLSYMDKLVPGSVKMLKSGKSVIYPSLKNGFDHLVSLEALLEYMDNCPVNTMQSIPLSCPIRILHGFEDSLIDYNNSLRLVEKVSSDDVQVKLIKAQGHEFAFCRQVRTALDDLLAESQRAHFADGVGSADVHQTCEPDISSQSTLLGGSNTDHWAPMYDLSPQ